GEPGVVAGGEGWVQLGDVVGMLVRDEDGVELGELDVPLQVGQGPGSRVDPDVEPVMAYQVAAGGRARLGARTARAEDDHLHEPPPPGGTATASIARTPGPRKCWATDRNRSGSPVHRNSGRSSARRPISRSSD